MNFELLETFTKLLNNDLDKALEYVLPDSYNDFLNLKSINKYLEDSNELLDVYDKYSEHCIKLYGEDFPEDQVINKVDSIVLLPEFNIENENMVI